MLFNCNEYPNPQKWSQKTWVNLAPVIGIGADQFNPPVDITLAYIRFPETLFIDLDADFEAPYDIPALYAIVQLQSYKKRTLI